MERDLVRRTSEWNLPDGPGRVVAQVGRQHADSQLRVPVEVEEALGAVDVVKGGEGDDGPVDGHRVEAQLPPASQEHPVRVGACTIHCFNNNEF